MRMPRYAADSKNNSCMLNRVIRIVQHTSNSTDVISLRKHNHLLKPIRCNNLNIVI